MSVATIASRYAKSLIDLATERGDLEAVMTDMNGLKQCISNKDFFLLLKSPVVKTERKLAVFKAIFDKSANPLTLGFVTLLTKKGRENVLPEITEEFFRQYKAIKNISTVKISTAAPIDASILQKIKSKLEESEVTRANVEIETEVDESLIGGFVIQLEDKRYDASLAYKINNMKKEFVSGLYEITF